MFGEMHIVHVNSKYNTSDKYLASPDGLAVLGFFIKVISPRFSRCIARVSKCMRARACVCVLSPSYMDFSFLTVSSLFSLLLLLL